MATLQELKDGLQAEFSSKILDGLPVLRYSSLHVLASSVAFLQHATEIALENKFNTLTPLTAVGSTLDGWGAFAGVTRLTPAQATGQVVLTGTSGVTVPAGTILTRCDGHEYVTDSEFTFPTDGEYAVDVTSTTTGTEGNLEVNGVLQLGTVVPGLGQQAISTGIGGGAYTEDDEAYRIRVINALQNPCRTGKVEDYDFWTREYPGVTRVCVVPKGNGPGTVKVYFMMDDAYPDGLPLASDVLAVQDSLFGDEGLAPPEVCGEVCSPELAEIDVVLANTEGVTMSEFAGVEQALEDVIRSSYDCRGATVCRLDLELAIKEQLPGVCFEMPVPSNNVQLTPGQFPVLGDLTVV